MQPLLVSAAKAALNLVTPRLWEMDDVVHMMETWEQARMSRAP